MSRRIGQTHLTKRKCWAAPKPDPHFPLCQCVHCEHFRHIINTVRHEPVSGWGQPPRNTQMMTNCGCSQISASSTKQCGSCNEEVIFCVALKLSWLIRWWKYPIKKSTHSLQPRQNTCVFTSDMWECSSELTLRRSELPFIDLPFIRTCLLGCQVSDSRKFLWIGTIRGPVT